MLSYTDLKPGIIFLLDGDPYKVLDFNLLKKQRSKPVVQTRIRNLKTHKTLDRNFRGSEKFEPVNIESRTIVFVYARGEEYWFHEDASPKERFTISTDIIGDAGRYLKTNTGVELLSFNDTILGLQLPIKMEFVVKEAPPGIKGDTAQGGSKEVMIETGHHINVPLFINEEDIIRINTETGEYTERVTKA